MLQRGEEERRALQSQMTAGRAWRRAPRGRAWRRAPRLFPHCLARVGAATAGLSLSRAKGPILRCLPWRSPSSWLAGWPIKWVPDLSKQRIALPGKCSGFPKGTGTRTGTVEDAGDKAAGGEGRSGRHSLQAETEN